MPEGNLGLDALVKNPNSIGMQPQVWARIADMVEKGDMPAPDAKAFPTDAERLAAVHSVRATLTAYEEEHAGEPGRVTMRRLTSGEYAYAIEDLTGVRIQVPIDASSDTVGGEGFTNIGDVQFMQDANIERYLEAAKLVADHAVIGSGPLAFYSDPGRTGLELSALARINQLYETHGIRLVSGEGGRPFGMERYASAYYVAWYYQHRVALGDPGATLRGLAQKEGITGRFAEHIWSAINTPTPGYPTNEMIARFKAFPAPTGDVPGSIANGRAAAGALEDFMANWPVWFFVRGALASAGAGDESPLVFNDKSLAVVQKTPFSYTVGGRVAARGRAAPAASLGSTLVFYFTNLNPAPGVKPEVIFRNVRAVRSGPLTQPAAGAETQESVGEPQIGPVAGQGGRRGRGGGAMAGGAAVGEPLQNVLPPGTSEALHFGMSPNGTQLGPDDFAITGTVSIAFPAGTTIQFQGEVEIGTDKHGAVRLVLADNADGVARSANQKVILADPDGPGHKGFRAGISQYLSLIPPNSHGEANPADKDPVPEPFDSTYNTPEHDAFVMKVKYQRSDQFLADNVLETPDRAALNIAWNDLLGSFPYHDAYLQMLVDHYGVKLENARMAAMTPEKMAALPAEMRGYLAPLRAEYERVLAAFKAAEAGQVEDAIAFASRAWRRPLSATEEAGLRAFYQKCRTTSGLEHEGALRALLARVLVSPAFLYRVETVAADAEKPLTGWEMASRLSFFMWSSIPDQELRRAAAAGELDKPEMLTKQVKRMAADPKARRIATEFFGQWLGFYRFDQYRGVDTTRFPEFTEDVRMSMYDESVTTFEYLVRENRPVKEILDADYAFLNQTLARFYGLDRQLDVPLQDTMAKVANAKALNKGGALRLGTVLTVTSAPLRTSPVKRGDWLLRRILGTPTPTPPADAGTLPGDPANFGGLTLRERLAQHKRNATCATCHMQIDPLGFPLEGFDALGRARTQYPDGKAVDVTGELPDGKTINGADGLVNYLGTKDKLVMQMLARKMLGYALGRPVMASDQRLINEMTAGGNGSSFADLAVKIVTSRQFRNHEGKVVTVAANPSPMPGATR